MHVILWEFRVRNEHIQQFISAYDSDGDWAKLFRRAAGYLGSELLRSAEEPALFLTIDRWEDETCYTVFQHQFGAEYKNLDNRLGGLTSSEKKLGVFRMADYENSS